MRRVSAILLHAFIALNACAQTPEPCGTLSSPGQYGPYDYRTDKDKLQVVEVNHFTGNVEKLISSITGTLGGDIDYTLRAFPNHHRALISMSRLAEKLKTEKPAGAHYSLACYFDRAINFRPDDGMVRVLHANYLIKSGRHTAAVEELQQAEKSLGDSSNLHYNLGLAYFGLKDYGKALAHAHRAYELGFPLPGLRNMLTREGKWSEQQSDGSLKADVPLAPRPDSQNSGEASSSVESK
jgi:tetratricopeptide (TPR) repeat protein